jgi:competence ComEA-like helix-hairpin-helix protein
MTQPMKLKQFALDYLSFNRAEQRGLTILMTALLVLVIVTRLLPAGREEATIDISKFEREIECFRKSLAAAQEAEQKKKAARYPRSNSSRYLMSAGDSGYRQKAKPVIRFTIELNATDTLELQRLRGIGPGYARRIIRYRDRLGGYLTREQLKEIDGIDSAKYAGIRDYLTADPDSVRRIGLNQATFKEMLRHPYFPYELTKEIFLYRKKVKSFKSIDELKRITGITDSVFNRIRGYVEVR